MTLPGSHAHQMPRGRIDDIAREFRDVWTAMRERTAAGPVVAAASRVVYVEDFGATGDGVTDDAAAINNALASGAKNVIFGLNTYKIGSLITRPTDVNMTGQGGQANGLNVAATRLLCSAAGAGLKIVGGGGVVQGIMVDGNSVATIGIQSGGHASGDSGADHHYSTVTVGACTDTNWLIESIQNAHFDSCRCSAGLGQGMVIDYGAGGLKFTRCEFDSATSNNLHIQATGAGPYGWPTHIDFDHCIFEYRATDGPQVLIDATCTGSTEISFSTCGFANLRAADTSPLVREQSGIVSYASCFWYSESGYAFEAKGAATTTFPRASFHGHQDVRGGGIAFLDFDANAIIDFKSGITGLDVDAGTPTTLFSAASPPGNLNAMFAAPVLNRQDLGTRLAEQSLVNGEVFARFTRNVNGLVKWGPGSGATDTTLQRIAANQLSTGDLFASRHLDPYTVTTLAANGGVTLDASVSGRHIVNLNGFNCTSVAVSNFIQTQHLQITFIQGGTPSTLTVPLAAAGFLWQGGDRNAPTLPVVASATLTVDLIGVNSTSMLEVGRNGSHMAKRSQPLGAPSTYYALPPYVAPAGAAVTSGLLTCHYVDLEPGKAYDQLAVNIPTTAQVGGTTVTSLGLYLDDGSGGYPDFTQQAANGTVTLTSTGVRSCSITYNPRVVRHWCVFLYVASVAPSPIGAPYAISTGVCAVASVPGGTAHGWSITGQTGLPSGALALVGQTNPVIVGVRAA